MRQYLNLLRHVLEHGSDRETRNGKTRALFGLQMRYNLAEGFPAVTTKKLYFNSVKGELLWFLSGSSDVRDLQKLGVHIWDANAEAPYWKPKARFPGDLGRIYGVQWRSWRKPDGGLVDQLHEVVENIKKEPASRRHLVTAWNPGELEEMALPPCHILFQFFVHDGKLSLQMYQRSCDMFLGVPFNIASYSLLLSMIAHVVGLEPGEFIHVLGDTHIYHDHFEQVKEQLSRKPYPLPKLWLNPAIRSIDKFRMEDIELVGYKHHPPILAPMLV